MLRRLTTTDPDDEVMPTTKRRAPADAYGRSIPAGDPREHTNPYQPSIFEDHTRLEERSSRTEPSNIHRIMREGAPNTYVVRHGRKKTGPFKSHQPEVWNEADHNDIMFSPEEKTDRTAFDSANNSYFAAKRQRTARNRQAVNQFVGERVPPTGPYQRSFVPPDLWHMLGLGDYKPPQ